MTSPVTRNCVVAAYGNALNDPPARQMAMTLAQQGWNVDVVQGPVEATVGSEPPPGVSVRRSVAVRVPGFLRPVGQVARWVGYGRTLALALRQLEPALVVTIMHHALAALPGTAKRRFTLASCIYDIPSMPDAGRLDSRIIREGWRRLASSDVVWASDRHKARLAAEHGGLGRDPIVCHNCPPLGWLPPSPAGRDPWLRAQLRAAGARIGEAGGCVVLRAGAIGVACGLEQTLGALRSQPDDLVFLMMGRPTEAYRSLLLERIHALGLDRRAFLWDRPSDETWKHALAGADVGHLIHAPPDTGPVRRLFDLNSSLSNNRLFQYMAAGLPIIAYLDARMTALYDEAGCFRVVGLGDLEADMARALQELAADPVARARMGDAARHAHATRYNWGQQVAPVIEAIEAARASRGRSSGQC